MMKHKYFISLKGYSCISDEIMESKGKYDKYVQLLRSNKNLILTGAPGTGKTFLAKAIAEEMGAEYEFVQFHPSYDYTDFVEGLRPTAPDKNGNIGFERKDGVFKKFCKDAVRDTSAGIDISATKDISSEDEWRKIMNWLKTQNGAKIESIRSDAVYTLKISQNKINLITSEGKSQYVNPNGVKEYLRTEEYDREHQTYEPALGNFIKEKCPFITHNKSVSQNKVNQNLVKIKRYVFIIDEINRGEISKIFGELFFSIDPGYRGEKGLVKTQYQNMITDESDPFYKGFYVPENVYIIGTMNDIDRSVESMDFAMRRRFAWMEVKALENTEILDDLSEMKDEVLDIMKRLNTAIWDEENNSGIEGLSASYHIGGAYFSKLLLYLDKEHENKDYAYRCLWENHLKGVLYEYLRGTLNAVENLKKLERVYFNGRGDVDIEG